MLQEVQTNETMCYVTVYELSNRLTRSRGEVDETKGQDVVGLVGCGV